ncbi:hypothetical protein Pmani_020286 [Petrolisthes manimaculis]|uniref:Acyl-coenzyme A thioesterase 13 n=1 Tax=Petrolisthes manimaculis TaxID=1843537 RepID=A0AAE1PI07_9EUCA|nr:hypothetical protein Pmani_020286 [Petrolisthes manimaculis]
MAGNGAKNFLQQVLNVVTKEGGFDRCLSQMRIVSAEKGRCVAEVKVEKEHTNRSGAMHGGYTATLVDVVTTMALLTVNQETPGVSVDLNMSYMKAAKTGDEILINAELLKSGKTLAFLSADIVNKETGALIARGSHTKYVG